MADARKKMKGKNKPSRRHRKKQLNIVEERKPEVKGRILDKVGGAGASGAPSLLRG